MIVALLAAPILSLVLAQEAMQFSRHPVSGVVIQHPSSWEAVVTTSYIAAVSPADDVADLYRENVTIMLQPVVRGTTLAAYAQSAQQALSNPEEGGTGVVMTDTSWAKSPAVRFTYSVRREIQGVQRTLRFMQVMRMLYDDVVMISTYAADSVKYESHLSVASAINESVFIQPR